MTQPNHPKPFKAWAVWSEEYGYYAGVLVANTPKCADQSAAIRLVREAVMTANAAIALKGIV
jgi:hypothetical protein